MHIGKFYMGPDGLPVTENFWNCHSRKTPSFF